MPSPGTVTHEFEVNLRIRVKVDAPHRPEALRYSEAFVRDAINRQYREGFYAEGFGEETALELVDVEALP